MGGVGGGGWLNSHSMSSAPECKAYKNALDTNIIPLRAKRVGEFNEIRHKQISPTNILSALGCL